MLQNIFNSKGFWLIYTYLFYATMLYASFLGLRFICKKGSSIFEVKVKPKHYKKIDVVAKAIMAVGIVIITAFYTLPLTLDIPDALRGTETRTTVIAVGNYDPTRVRTNVLWTEVLVQQEDDGVQFYIYLLTGPVKSGEVLEIEYLPFSKQAHKVYSGQS